MSDLPILAHTDENGATETLDAHARAVARLARRLADRFDAGDLGFAAGLLHDLGKSKSGFQEYLRRERGSVPHSAEGARFVARHYALKCPPPFAAPIGRLVAFAIAGHHAGLANGSAMGGGTQPLEQRLAEAEDISPWFDPAELPALSQPPAPLKAARLDPFGWAFFTRMLFSALVDADFLETERWFGEVAGEPVPRGWSGHLADLKNSLDAHLAAFAPDGSEIAQLRAEVLSDCRTAARTQHRGLFTLTVPTGGGKTLSSLAFALDHALRHGLERVIYVIPFTSIVEQTAAVFRTALGDPDAVLEHHSAFDADKLEQRGQSDGNTGAEKLRLAAQNWDRPIMVTTAVQFFESLFANRPSRCRKLHNIARSVVVLDEAQTLPIKVLRPCLAALRELARGYDTSIVLCTATQPAVTRPAGLKAPEALEGVREIIPKERNLFGRLSRVRVEQGETLSDGQLVNALKRVNQGLVIVNTRRHARELSDLVQGAGLAGARHLTTAMTAAHRQHALREIRDDICQKRPVRLVATSLIEAGVDISFEAVWRAWAGLDQIAQAAGRCNRNGELGLQGGRLVIFAPEEKEGRSAPRELEQNAETAKRVLRDGIHALSPEATAAYFRELLWTREDGGRWLQLDNMKVGESEIHGIIAALAESAPGLNFRFADVAQAFRIIEDTMLPVIIPASAHAVAGAPRELIGSIPHRKSAGGIARDLQRFIVQIPRRARGRLLSAGAARTIEPETFGDQFVVLVNEPLYGDAAGLGWDDPTYRSIESTMF